MITPILPAGRVTLRQDKYHNDLVLKFRGNEYFISIPDASRAWAIGTAGCKIETANAECAGEFSRIDHEAFQAIINKHRYLIPVLDLVEVLSCRQIAAPVIDAEPGQQVLELVPA